MDISTGWLKSNIHTWIYPWISISTASLTIGDPYDHPFLKRVFRPHLLNVAMRIPAKRSQIAEEFLWEAYRNVGS